MGLSTPRRPVAPGLLLGPSRGRVTACQDDQVEGGLMHAALMADPAAIPGLVVMAIERQPIAVATDEVNLGHHKLALDRTGGSLSLW